MKRCGFPRLDVVLSHDGEGGCRTLRAFALNRALTTCVAVLTALLLACAFACAPAGAAWAEEGAEGESATESPASKNPPTEGGYEMPALTAAVEDVTVSTAKVTFTTTNKTFLTWKNSKITVSLPAGVSLAPETDSYEKSFEAVENGETISFTLNLVYDQQTTGVVSADQSDGVVASEPEAASANVEATESEGVLDAGQPYASFEGNVVVPDWSMTIPAKLVIGSVDSSSFAVAAVSKEDHTAVSANAEFTEANYAEFALVSDMPFASGLDASHLVLGDAFSDMEIKSIAVDKSDAQRAVVRLVGCTGEAGTDGTITFTPGAFEDPNAVGQAVVSVEQATVTFDVRNSVRDIAANTLTIPLTVKNGVLAQHDEQDAVSAGKERMVTVRGDVVPDPSDPTKASMVIYSEDGILSDDAVRAALGQIDALCSGSPVMGPGWFVGWPPVLFEKERFLVPDESAGEPRQATAEEMTYAEPYGTVKAVSYEVIPDKRPAGDNPESNPANKQFARTADIATWAFAVVAVATVAALALFAFSRSQARKAAANKVMASLLALVLVVGLAPAVPQEALADQATPDAAKAASTAGSLEPDQQYDSLRVNCKITFGALGGSINLESADQITLPGQAEDDQGLMENAQITIDEVGSDYFTYHFTIAPEQMVGWDDEFAASGQTPEEAEAALLADLTTLMCGHEVDLADGVVKSRLGMSQGPATIVLSQTDSYEDIAAGAEHAEADLAVASAGSAALQSEEQTAKQVMESLEKIAAAIGQFASGKGGIAGGISNIFGLIAGMIDPSPTVSLQDLYNELQDMKGQLTRMETSVDKLAVELQAVDKRAGFDAEWYQAKWLVDHLSSYGSLYTTLAGKVDATDEFTTWEDMSPANQKLFNQYVNAVEKKDKLLNTSVVDDTMKLGALIEGTGPTDLVGDYFNWVETYYNWDPETFAQKDAFMATLQMAYIYGYGASMAYMNAESMKAKDDPFSDNPFEEDLYDEEIAALKKQAVTVLQKLVGTVEMSSDGKSYSIILSKYRAATEHLGYWLHRYYRNLLNNKIYDASSFLTNNFGANSFSMASVEKGALHLYTMKDSAFDLAQLEQMQANLPLVRASVKGFSGVENLCDEFMLLAGQNEMYIEMGEYQKNEEHSWYRARWYYETKDNPNAGVSVGKKTVPNKYLFAVSDARYNKLIDQTAIQHVRSVTMDAYNIQTGKVERDVVVGHHKEYWHLGHSQWTYEHDLWPVVASSDAPVK